MDNLEKYIKENSEAFDTAELPEGHLDRFVKKLDASPSVSGTAPVGERSRTIRMVIWSTIAIAAAISAIMFISRPKDNEKEWFANVSNDQFEICSAYYEIVSEIYEKMLAKNPDAELEYCMESVSEETIPLVDQLPEELEPEARAAILKEYYGALLDGLDRISKVK
ncbi:MAG: hypothetical protein J5886_02875 [Bacteroidales bacterium]|nr:hypothetical protein [Bacteroidales bacterium]